jgi:acyl dehydratase
VRVFDSLAELFPAVGEQLGPTGWHTVTQQQVDMFAESTGDRQWIHVDPVRAASGPFGTTVTHGYLTLAMIPMLGQQLYRFDNIAMALNYGTNRVRYPQPLPVGSRVRGSVEIAEVTPARQGVQAVFRWTIAIEGAHKPACVAETVVLLVAER